MEIEAAVLVVFLAAAFVRYRNGLQRLRQQLMEYRVGGALPLADDARTAFCLDVIEQLQMQLQEETAASERRLQETEEYYALWVHQIKTPIAAAKLLLQTGESGAWGEQETCDLEQELFWIEQYVQMALQYQRLAAANDLLLQRISVDTVVRTVIRRFARVMIRRQITVRYEDCSIFAVSDAKWLDFVIGQVLSNAVKYSAAGTAITISTHTDADVSYLVISDEGIGIRGEDIPRIFEKGYTGGNGRIDRSATGIGLYLCREVLQRLGHTISVSSVVGEGTSVSIGFPQKEIDPRD